MKKVINGKLYNTETAELLAFIGNGRNCSDFRFYEETVYKTKNGALFLHKDGGALSQMAEPCGNNGTCGSQTIETLTPDQAIAWAEENSAKLHADEQSRIYKACKKEVIEA